MKKLLMLFFITTAYGHPDIKYPNGYIGPDGVLTSPPSSTPTIEPKSLSACEPNKAKPTSFYACIYKGPKLVLVIDSPRASLQTGNVGMLGDPKAQITASLLLYDGNDPPANIGTFQLNASGMAKEFIQKVQAP